MSKSKENHVETNRISLDDMATRYLNALQKTYDMVCYSLAGSRRLSESDYDEFSNQLQVMPRQTARMEFEHAKENTEQWILRNSLSDSLALVMPVLEDARTICALCDFKKEKSEDAEKLKKISTDDRAKFLQLPLAEKFDFIEKEYGVGCEVKEHITALMDITKALMTKEGVLSEEEADESGQRVVRIRSVQIVQAPGETADVAQSLNLTRKIGDSERVIKVGDKIHFSKAEHMGSILTVGIFITEILKGIQTYAHKTGVAEDVPAK